MRFRIAGTNVHVQGAFWITALLLGAGIRQPGLLALWIVVVFVSVLIHELGHVAAMRWTGSRGDVVLTAFGGVAIPTGPSAPQSIQAAVLVSAAGPVAQMLLGLLVAILVILAGGGVQVVQSSMGIPYPRAVLVEQGYYPHYTANFLLYVSFFWSLLNLIPVYPLDGGQIAGALLGIRTALIVSLALSIGIAAWSLMTGGIYIGVLFAWLAFSNVQALRQK